MSRCPREQHGHFTPQPHRKDDRKGMPGLRYLHESQVAISLLHVRVRTDGGDRLPVHREHFFACMIERRRPGKLFNGEKATWWVERHTNSQSCTRIGKSASNDMPAYAHQHHIKRIAAAFEHTCQGRRQGLLYRARTSFWWRTYRIALLRQNPYVQLLPGDVSRVALRERERGLRCNSSGADSLYRHCRLWTERAKPGRDVGWAMHRGR